nr:desmin-like [Gasterosteus aculeatus aculeatus]
MASDSSSSQTAMNQKFLTPQTNEKVELQHLDDDFPSVIERVRRMELQKQNPTLLAEVKRPQGRKLTYHERLMDQTPQKEDVESRLAASRGVSNMNQAVDKNYDALKQEIIEFRKQIQPYTHDIGSLKDTNESLIRQMRDMEYHHRLEAGSLLYYIATLEMEIVNMREEMEHMVQEHQGLLHVKRTQDLQIAATRKMLEEEESRIAVREQSFSKPNPKETSREQQVRVVEISHDYPPGVN